MARQAGRLRIDSRRGKSRTPNNFPALGQIFAEETSGHCVTTVDDRSVRMSFALPEAFRGVTAGLFAMTVGLLLAVATVKAIVTGELWYGRPGVWLEVERRSERPLGFWFVVAPLAILSAAMLLLGCGVVAR
jgi:hypothetical protein